MSKKTYYMHTLLNRPAYYVDGEQIYYATRTSKGRLAKSLKQIKQEQKKSFKYRTEVLGYADYYDKYGYVKVCL